MAQIERVAVPILVISNIPAETLALQSFFLFQCSPHAKKFATQQLGSAFLPSAITSDAGKGIQS